MNEVGKFIMRDLKHISIDYSLTLEKRVKELCSYIAKAYGYKIKLNDYEKDTIEFDFIPSHIELQGRCAETHDETSVIPIINCGQIYHVSYESFLWTMLEETLDIKVDSCEPNDILITPFSNEIISRSYVFYLCPKQEVTYEEEKGCNDYHYEKENGGC